MWPFRMGNRVCVLVHVSVQIVQMGFMLDLNLFTWQPYSWYGGQCNSLVGQKLISESCLRTYSHLMDA